MVVAATGCAAFSNNGVPSNAHTPGFIGITPMDDDVDTPLTLMELGYVPGQLLVGMQTPMLLEEARDFITPLIPDSDIVSISDLTDVSQFAGTQARVGRQIFLLELDIENMLWNERTVHMREAIEALERNPQIAYAEHNLMGSACAVPHNPDDTHFANGDLWGMERIQAPEAWGVTTGSRDVMVGVLDTGIDHNHADLAANVNVSMGYNFLFDNPHWWYEDSSPMDDLGHGTHVAGTIGALGNNGEGVAGVCWEVTMVPLKIWDARGRGSTAEFISALAYAEYMGIPILNVSGRWKSFEFWDEGYRGMRDAIQAYSGLIIAAAGNDAGWDDDGDEELGPFVSYPAAFGYDNIISVSASCINDGISEFSSRNGALIDLAAPGDYIFSTLPWGYAAWRGTSMATAHVTGVAALLKSYNNTLTAAEIKAAILENVDHSAELEGMVRTSGRLNAFRALSSIEPSSGVTLPEPERVVIELEFVANNYYADYYHMDTYFYDFWFYDMGGAEGRFIATVYPYDANQTVTWSSSNPNVITIDENGYFIVSDNEAGDSGENVGDALVTATAWNGATASILINNGFISGR